MLENGSHKERLLFSLCNLGERVKFQGVDMMHPPFFVIDMPRSELEQLGYERGGTGGDAFDCVCPACPDSRARPTHSNGSPPTP